MNRNKRTTTSMQTAAVMAVSALFILTAILGLYKCFSKPPAVEQGTPAGTNTAAPTQSSQLEADSPVDAASNTLSPDARKDSFYTILVGGLDDENGGSDTNLLVALDAAGGSINVLSLPRDTLLNVSWTVKKLNHAYHNGGISSTMEQISNLLGIPVDFYITVDLRGFVELVDGIGGVDFDIPLDMDYDDPYQDLHIHLPKGPRHLDGEEALQVVRWRQNNDGTEYPTRDIGRIGTQQAFLTAVAKQMLQLSNWDKIPQYAQIFQEHVEMDERLSLPNLIWIGEQALTVGVDNIHFYTLPGDGAGYYKGVSYYVLDPEDTLEMINASFNPYLRELTLDDMDILVP